MPKNYRMRRIADLVRTTLAEILLRETEDKRFREVTITRVMISRDLSHAKIYVSFMPDQDAQEMTTALNYAAKYLRYHLAQEVELRITPELKFYYDDSNVKGQKIVELLSKALKGKD